MRKLFAFQSATILDNLLSLVCIQIDLFNFEGKETHQLLFVMVETLECWSFHIEKAICIRLPIATSVSIFQAHIWVAFHAPHKLFTSFKNVVAFLIILDKSILKHVAYIVHEFVILPFLETNFKWIIPEPRKNSTAAWIQLDSNK